MATFEVEGDKFALRLTSTEHLEALHGDVIVPLASVRSVEVLDDAMSAVHGVRFGTGIPGRVAVGTFTSKSTRIFAVVHHRDRGGVRVRLSGAEFDELVVSAPDPEAVAQSLPVTSP